MKMGDSFTQNLLISEPPLQVLPSLAVKVGLNEAIVLQQFHYWLQRSTNVKDGYKWIYNSYPEWNKQFPFWSLNTLKRAIHRLEKNGYLISGNYNRAGFDKTKWYRINYELLDVGQRSIQNGSTMNPEWVDGTYQNGSTNTNRLPENTTINKTTADSKESASDKNQTSKKQLDEAFEKLWKLYPRKTDKQTAKKKYIKAIKDGTTNKEIQDGIVGYLKQIKVLGTPLHYVKGGGTWFSKHAWEDEYETSSEPHVLKQEKPSKPKSKIDSKKKDELLKEARERDKELLGEK